MKLLLGCVVAIALIQCADCAHAKSSVLPLGPGNVQCSAWSQNRSVGSEFAGEDIGWILGFFSGFNEYFEGNRRPFMREDQENIVSAIDRFCLRHPGDTLAEAAKALIESIQRPYQSRRSVRTP